MREFGGTQLERKLVASGFREVHLLDEESPLLGILFDRDLSQPLIARKQPFAMNTAQRRELVNVWRHADRLAEQIRLASQSRWLRLGRKLGLGPKFE